MQHDVGEAEPRLRHAARLERGGELGPGAVPALERGGDEVHARARHPPLRGPFGGSTSRSRGAPARPTARAPSARRRGCRKCHVGRSTCVRRISPSSIAAATDAAPGAGRCGTRAASPHCAGTNSCACTATNRRTTSGADASNGRRAAPAPGAAAPAASRGPPLRHVPPPGGGAADEGRDHADGEQHEPALPPVQRLRRPDRRRCCRRMPRRGRRSRRPAGTGRSVAVTSLSDAARRRIGSTNCVNAITMTIAATWFVTSEPRPTPIVRPERHRQHAAADERPRVALVELGVEAERRERGGARADRGGEGDHAEPRAHDELATRTSRREHDVDRCGSARNVGVRVLCRNSPVTARAPSSTGNT